jgi:hypothetical protein
MTPLDEGLACRRDLYLTTYNTHNKHPCPRRDFFFVLSLYFVFLCADCPGVCSFSVLYNMHNTTQISMPPAGFEPAIPAGEGPQTYAIDHAVTGIGHILCIRVNYKQKKCLSCANIIALILLTSACTMTNLEKTRSHTFTHQAVMVLILCPSCIIFKTHSL